ncbi:hypothetical protein JCGZ_15385 [Jatropha curcas]|uniref:Uncharacterized protein n=1 Tax=Jatropha curcas TaxID=180498 RepID=A0A067K921_JATCU|nr:hypothetical protein JCGZ_15385 [Jatropha curcas]
MTRLGRASLCPAKEKEKRTWHVRAKVHGLGVLTSDLQGEIFPSDCTGVLWDTPWACLSLTLHLIFSFLVAQACYGARFERACLCLLKQNLSFKAHGRVLGHDLGVLSCHLMARAYLLAQPGRADLWSLT